jgi:competence protein ComGC
LKPISHNRSRNPALNLVDVLVVIGITAILIAIFLPCFIQYDKTKAQRTGLADGSVQQLTSAGLQNLLSNSMMPLIRLAIP